jgi:subtilisin family serine protease
LGNEIKITTQLIKTKLKIFKMKKIITLFTTLLLISCSTQESEMSQKSMSETNNTQRITTRQNYSKNSLVIKFANGVSEPTKQFLRKYHQVISHKLCSHCSNRSIELWMFDENIEIEPKKETISNPTGGMNFPPQYTSAIQAVDLNFDIDVASTNTSPNTTPISLVNSYQSYIKNTNNGITIAVFDTGIKPDAGDSNPIFQNQFLYNSNNDTFPQTISGWDFVNNDNNCSDDDPNLHGTAVSFIITSILNTNDIPHQIMPLKICNAAGKASYFNLLCALNYSLEQNVSVLQMSLGWYNNNPGNLVDSIFLDLVNQHPNTIIICSAGNDGQNNDVASHYPSGYNANNIIAIASCKQDISNISDWSNYGADKVDFYAHGENIDFLGNTIEGTSFASPKVAAIVAKLKYLHPTWTSEQILQNLINQGIQCSFTRPVKYNKILNP